MTDNTVSACKKCNKCDKKLKSIEEFVLHNCYGKPTKSPTETVSERLIDILNTKNNNFEKRDAILTLLSLSVQEAKAEMADKISKLKPRGFGFDKASMDMGYNQALVDVVASLKQEEKV